MPMWWPKKTKWPDLVPQAPPTGVGAAVADLVCAGRYLLECSHPSNMICFAVLATRYLGKRLPG